MKVKRIIAGGLAAAAAGATLLFGAMAASTSLGDFVTVSDSSLSSPTIVIAAPSSVSNPAYANDVMGAADIAAAVAGFATTTVTTGGGTSVSVSGGVDLATSNTKIYLGDQLIKSGLRTTLTAANLPDLLPKETFTDNSGGSYTYNQYVNFGNGNVTFGTSGGQLNDPVLYLDTGTSTSTPFYNMSVTFNKLLNISSSDVQGQTITLFGNDYTIGSTSVFAGASGDKLVLFGGGGSSQVIAEGQEVTMSASGLDHKVKVIGVSSTTQAVISIDGVTQTVTKGQTKVINGVSVYVKDVFFFGKEAQVSQVELSLGANKITLTQGGAVTTGQNDENTIDGTLVTLTGTGSQGISKLDISVTAKDTNSNYIVAGSSFTDPVFGALKLAFGGLSTGITDTITVDNSGTNAASLKFTDYRGNEKSILWAYTSAGTFTPMLNSTSTRAYHVIEGEPVSKNDFALLAPTQESEFGHIFEYTIASSLGNSGAYIELKDVYSLDTTRIYLTDNAGAGANTAANFYVDGQQYFVNVTPSSQKAVFTWGPTAGEGVTGGSIMAFPLIKTKAGEYVALLKPINDLANGTYLFPGDKSTHVLTSLTKYVVAGRFNYTLTGAGAATANLTGVKAITSGTTMVDLVAAPAVLVYEQKARDSTDTDVQDGTFVTINRGSGATIQTTVTQPVLSDALAIAFSAQTTDNSVSETYDRRGAHVTYDSDSQGLATIVEPQDQATSMVGAGSSPSFSTATGTGGTIKAAVQIKSPVTKLESEISTTSLNSDLILLGGPCANTLVAQLLSSDNITCSSWSYQTGLIKEVAGAFGSSHKALIVAGTQGTDTRALAAKVMQGTLAFST